MRSRPGCTAPSRSNLAAARRGAPFLLLLGALLAGCAGNGSPAAPPTSQPLPHHSPSPSRPPSAAAKCPVLTPSKAPVVRDKLPCTSVASGRAAAAELGFKLRDDGPTVMPYVNAAVYDKRVLTAPVRSARELVIAYADNGGVLYLQCSGIVGKTLDPVFNACTDVGGGARSDLPTVRAWALAAQATIARNHDARPTLNTATIRFIACQDRLWASGAPGFATQIYINAEPLDSGYGATTLCG